MLLTVDDVARRLRISRSMVYEMIRQGNLPCHRIGNGRGLIRISEGDLVTYVDRTRCEPVCDRQAPRRLSLKHLRRH